MEMLADIRVSLMLHSLGEVETRQGSMELLFLSFFFPFFLSTEGQNQEGKQRQERQERCRGTPLPFNCQDSLCCFLHPFPCLRKRDNGMWGTSVSSSLQLTCLHSETNSPCASSGEGFESFGETHLQQL